MERVTPKAGRVVMFNGKHWHSSFQQLNIMLDVLLTIMYVINSIMSKLEEKVNEILGIDKMNLPKKLSNKNLNQTFLVKKKRRC